MGSRAHACRGDMTTGNRRSKPASTRCHAPTRVLPSEAHPKTQNMKVKFFSFFKNEIERRHQPPSPPVGGQRLVGHHEIEVDRRGRMSRPASLGGYSLGIVTRPGLFFEKSTSVPPAFFQSKNKKTVLPPARRPTPKRKRNVLAYVGDHICTHINT